MKQEMKKRGRGQHLSKISSYEEQLNYEEDEWRIKCQSESKKDEILSLKIDEIIQQSKQQLERAM